MTGRTKYPSRKDLNSDQLKRSNVSFPKEGAKLLNNKRMPNNYIYQLLSKNERNMSLLHDLNLVLKSDSNLSLLNLNDPALGGSLLHYLTQTAQSTDNVSWRLVYALSNSGIDVNMQNAQGNTALHLAYMRGYTEVGFEFIEALLKVGTDLSIKNKNNKTALNYMEDIEQLNSMYEAHHPGIWTAVIESSPNEVQRLMNAWVKVNIKKNDVKLVESTTDAKVAKILDDHSLSNDFVHALLAVDFKRMEHLIHLIGDNFDPNMADFCYCFSWFRPVYRNLPKFLIEIALDTKQEELVRMVLSLGCDVNLPNIKNGDPFYFYAFDHEYQNLRDDFLLRSNLNIKNQRGQSVLFHIVNLNLKIDSNNQESQLRLIEDFNVILKKYPLILTHRDQDDMTLVETILSMSPHKYKKSIIFLKEIAKFILFTLKEKNFKFFQEMIYQSYGLILLNTPILIHDETSITFEDYVIKNNPNEMKLYLRKLFDADFFMIVNEFASGIKTGDLSLIKDYLGNEKNYFLIRIRDYSGRSCLHLAVLYGQAKIVRFFLQHDSNLIKAIDNLNRTALHYAFALKDAKCVEILLEYKINKFARDSKFLLAEEYKLDEVLNDDWFKVKNFKETETKKSKAILTFLKCFQYKKIKHAIEANDVDYLKELNSNLKIYELSFADFPVLKLENSFVEGEEYLPLLELAIKYESFSAFRFILEKISESILVNLKELKSKNQLPTKKIFESYLVDLRERAEEQEMHEIIDILDNTEEDKEISAVTLERLNSSLNNNNNLNKNQEYIDNILAKKNAKKIPSTLDTLQRINNLEVANKSRNVSNLKRQNDELENDLSKNSKICSIL